MARERILTAAEAGPEEQRVNYALRPTRFDNYVGQPTLIKKLRIAVEAARRRNESVDHCLFHGPPGLGKTTLAHVIANEIGTRVHITTGPALTKAADLAGILMNLGERDVLFIDEIHRVNTTVEEYLYSSMEDFRIEITLDGGMHARVASIDLKPFTLVGATTRLGLLTGPMRSRFGLVEHLDFYRPEELHTILALNVRKLELKADESALTELARRSRGTPRIANKLLRRTRDFAEVKTDTMSGDGRITREVADYALNMLDVDEAGLDDMDARILLALMEKFDGGPVGVSTIAVAVGEDAGTVEEVYEPYLIQEGFMARTPRGRVAARRAYDHFDVVPPMKQSDIFDELLG